MHSICFPSTLSQEIARILKQYRLEMSLSVALPPAELDRRHSLASVSALRAYIGAAGHSTFFASMHAALSTAYTQLRTENTARIRTAFEGALLGALKSFATSLARVELPVVEKTIRAMQVSATEQYALQTTPLLSFIPEMTLEFSRRFDLESLRARANADSANVESWRATIIREAEIQFQTLMQTEYTTMEMIKAAEEETEAKVGNTGEAEGVCGGLDARAAHRSAIADNGAHFLIDCCTYDYV
jgi:hypothetical protein